MHCGINKNAEESYVKKNLNKPFWKSCKLYIDCDNAKKLIESLKIMLTATNSVQFYTPSEPIYVLKRKKNITRKQTDNILNRAPQPSYRIYNIYCNNNLYKFKIQTDSTNDVQEYSLRDSLCITNKNCNYSDEIVVEQPASRISAQRPESTPIQHDIDKPVEPKYSSDLDILNTSDKPHSDTKSDPRNKIPIYGGKK